MLEAIFWFLCGAAVMAGAWAWWRLPTRRAIRGILRASQAYARGDWRQRVPPESGDSATPPAAPGRVARDVRELGILLNQMAPRTLRQIKDLARQRSDLYAIVDALPDPILLADTRRKVILINQPAAALLGVSKEQALGQTIEAAVSEPAVLELFDRVAKIGLADTSPEGQLVLPLRRQVRLSRDGQPLAYQAVATRSGAGGVLVVLRDISTLDQTLRMKADFVANAGHELRTPVSAIKAAYETLAEILEEDRAAVTCRSASAVQRCMSILGGHLLRLEEMLRDLLDLSRVESGEQKPAWERVTAADLSRDLRQVLSGAAAKKDIRLVLPTDEAAAELEFVTDYRLLMLAVKNLVENGIKYTPPGGEVELKVERRELDPKAAAMHRRLTDSPYREVHVIVRDTGIGIAAEHLPRVFERFFQVDTARTGTNPRTSGRGTGLGLSIVKHAVGALGGSISVQSEPTVGSTFTIALPQFNATPAAEAQEHVIRPS